MITFGAGGNGNTTGTTNYTRFPMWGETAAAQVISSATSLGTITLLRALARIDVGCALSGETAAGVNGSHVEKRQRVPYKKQRVMPLL